MASFSRVFAWVGAGIVVAPLALFGVAAGWLQALLSRFGPRSMAFAVARTWHRFALFSLGVRVARKGEPMANGPVLLVGNHISWLDIPILASQAQLRFVSKSDVAGWPVVRTLARLQQTIFVDRTRRQASGAAADGMRAAFAQGDRVVLFAEGTSSDGNAVLPFRSALLGAIAGELAGVQIQPFSIAYTKRDGLHLSRQERGDLGWYGDVDMTSSFLAVVQGGPLDIEVTFGKPQTLEELGGRKQAALDLHGQVRQMLVASLRPS